MKYVLGVFGFIILTIIAVVLLASTTGSRSNDIQEGPRVINLTDHIGSGTVVYTVQGEIVGDQDYREVRVIVTPTERRVQVLDGYNEAVEKQEAFVNNPQAFDTFMRALDNAGFTRERETQNKDIRGVCPLGRRYVYQLHDGGKEVLNLWSASCSSRMGTGGGSTSLIGDLFENQIPDYNKFISGVSL